MPQILNPNSLELDKNFEARMLAIIQASEIGVYGI